MTKKIWFGISCSGLCSKCDSKAIFWVATPENWDEMTDDEKEEWAYGEFFSEVQWSWGEV